MVKIRNVGIGFYGAVKLGLKLALGKVSAWNQLGLTSSNGLEASVRALAPEIKGHAGIGSGGNIRQL